MVVITTHTHLSLVPICTFTNSRRSHIIVRRTGKQDTLANKTVSGEDDTHCDTQRANISVVTATSKPRRYPIRQLITTGNVTSQRAESIRRGLMPPVSGERRKLTGLSMALPVMMLSHHSRHCRQINTQPHDPLSWMSSAHDVMVCIQKKICQQNKT